MGSISIHMPKQQPPVKKVWGQGRAEVPRNKSRLNKLRNKALAMGRQLGEEAYPFYKNERVRLTINYNRKDGKMDAANIVGRIADAFTGVFYPDDFQIREICYRERQARKVDSYHVTVEAI